MILKVWGVAWAPADAAATNESAGINTKSKRFITCSLLANRASLRDDSRAASFPPAETD
jgi:hypothetical protein